MTGEELKIIRKKLGFSQQKLSEEFGVSVRQIINLESGLTPIKEIYVEKISLLKMKLKNQNNMKNRISTIENLGVTDKEIEILFAYRELDEDEKDIFYYELKVAEAKKRKKEKEICCNL